MRWLPLVLIAMLAVAAALQVGRRPQASGGPVFDGAALYTQHCARCHLADGRGRGPMPDLRTSQWSDAEMRRIISQGRGRMPRVPVQGAALDSLVGYVQNGL
jgi:mono/diheme cytochrome c family protein